MFWSRIRSMCLNKKARCPIVSSNINEYSLCHFITPISKTNLASIIESILRLAVRSPVYPNFPLFSDFRERVKSITSIISTAYSNLKCTLLNHRWCISSHPLRFYLLKTGNAATPCSHKSILLKHLGLLLCGLLSGRSRIRVLTPSIDFNSTNHKVSSYGNLRVQFS